MSRRTTNNKQNLERYVILQTVLLHFTGKAIQEGVLKEELLVAPVTHAESVLVDVSEDPGALTVPNHKGF